MKPQIHKNDLPANVKFGKRIAIDTETMGLLPSRDRLCVVQISNGDGDAHIIQMDRDNYDAPNLKKLLNDQGVLKIFHFARFDIAILKKYLNVTCTPVYCTRTASKIARTYTDKHGLREVCRELLDVDLNKQQQSSDWGAATLSEEQIAYAANDVLYLHKLQDKFDEILTREGRKELAYKCFEFLPLRADLDLAGWAHTDIFEH